MARRVVKMTPRPYKDRKRAERLADYLNSLGVPGVRVRRVDAYEVYGLTEKGAKARPPKRLPK